VRVCENGEGGDPGRRTAVPASTTISDFLLAFEAPLPIEWQSALVTPSALVHRSFRSRRTDLFSLQAQALRLRLDGAGPVCSREAAADWAPSKIYGKAESVPARRGPRSSGRPDPGVRGFHSAVPAAFPAGAAVASAFPPVPGAGEPEVDESEEPEPVAGRKARRHQRREARPGAFPFPLRHGSAFRDKTLWMDPALLAAAGPTSFCRRIDSGHRSF
jgi:hypothetical protein